MGGRLHRAGGGLGVNVRQAARLCSRDSSTLWSLLLHKKAYLWAVRVDDQVYKGKRCPSSELVLVWHSPPGGMSCPPPSVIRTRRSAHQQASRSSQIPVSPQHPALLRRSTGVNSSRRNVAARAANAEETKRCPPLEAQGYTRATERHLQILETKNLNTEMKKKAQVVRQAARQTPLCDQSIRRLRRGVFW